MNPCEHPRPLSRWGSPDRGLAGSPERPGSFREAKKAISERAMVGMPGSACGRTLRFRSEATKKRRSGADQRVTYVGHCRRINSRKRKALTAFAIRAF